MAKLQYEFLEDSFLFDKKHIDTEFSMFGESELFIELERYGEFCRENLIKIEQHASQSQSPLKTYIQDENFNPNFLKQTALYLDEIVVADPLIRFSSPPNQMSSTYMEFLGVETESLIDRNELASVLSKLKSIIPMVDYNYINMTPRGRLEALEHIPITYNENQFSDMLDENILKHYHSNVELCFGAVKNGLLVMSPNYGPSRFISVKFGDDAASRLGYNLLDTKIMNEKGDDGLMEVRFNMPDSLPSNEELNNWIFQSINRTAVDHYERLTKDVHNSTAANANLLLSSQFNSGLIGCNMKTIQQVTANTIINVDLPFLDDIQIYDLMRVRRDDGEVFEGFRRYLESQFRELRTETDPEKIDVKVDNIIHEVTEVKIHEIQQKAAQVRRGALASSVIVVGSLAASVMTSGWSLLGGLVAAAKGYKTYEEYNSKVKDNPCCFLWKVKESKK